MQFLFLSNFQFCRKIPDSAMNINVRFWDDDVINERDRAYDKGRNCCQGKIYDEIVQGYEDGTREQYTADQSSEDHLSVSGYRKLTMSEEIDALNSAFEKYAKDVYAKRKEDVL